MFEFLRCMFLLGRIDGAALARYVAVGRITAQQYEQITGQALPAAKEA